MYIRLLFRKQRIAGTLNPKEWACGKPRLAHIITHAYNGEIFFNCAYLVRYMKVTMSKIAIINDIELVKVGCDYTHCHFVIRQQPTQDLRKMVNKLKGGVSREMRMHYDWLKQFPHFWSKSFYVTFYKDSGNNKLFSYIKNQAREQHETIVPPL